MIISKKYEAVRSTTKEAEEVKRSLKNKKSEVRSLKKKKKKKYEVRRRRIIRRRIIAIRRSYGRAKSISIVDPSISIVISIVDFNSRF